ncbi:SDR family NAD(P)-dependent oxidoreductase [Oceanicella actignis]|uniref:SDR family NAD(P)-dependent oxidoreductase n=1 Tax=Oceanicella actignis TaxID=1189325 RepID=UPI00125C8DA1|nr:SDR family NAD(P)-dependent oxidoreductase [Oceanicella actignis]TYO89660.1 NADP-dependent 3-hydroxy acid dehydrogenase YdfG [Oceanicella actignis]
MALMVIAGASRGIGLELARQAAARGDEVLACARRPDAAPALAALCERSGGRVRAAALDVTDPDSCDRAARELGARQADLLVCNAGVFIGRGGLDDPALDARAWRETLMTNVAGPFFVVRAFRARMRRPGGKIAVIGSRMGSSAAASGDAYAYRASKAAAANLALNLSRELAPEGLAVGVWHPGWVATEMGGPRAALTPERSARDLLARFDALTLARTGLFEDHEGRPIPF